MAELPSFGALADEGTRGQVLYPIHEAGVEVVAPDVLSFLERWAAALVRGDAEWREEYGHPAAQRSTIELLRRR